MSLERPDVRLPVTWKDRRTISGLHTPFHIKVSFEGKERQSIKFYALYLGK